MATLITDPDLEARLIAERRDCGADRHDEVWDGLYVMSPNPNDEHQEIVMGLSFALQATVAPAGLGKVRPGVNVSDRDDDWAQNYRVPDVVVYLNGTSALNRGTHWLGGPDLAVEVVSKGDRAREKLDFYAGVLTRELLVVDRDPWALELYRLRDGALLLQGASTPERPEALVSDVVPLTFRVGPGDPRPVILVEHRDGLQRWTV